MKTSCICTSFTTAILILASCLTHLATSSRCTIDLQTHKITRRGNKYHIKVGNGEDKVYTVENMVNCMYMKKCHAIKITEEVIPFQNKENLICGKIAYPTMICGGQCPSGTHPKSRDRDMCIACGPGVKDRKRYKKVVECIDRETNELVEKTLELNVIEGCGCNKYKCQPLLNRALFRLF